MMCSRPVIRALAGALVCVIPPLVPTAAEAQDSARVTVHVRSDQSRDSILPVHDAEVILARVRSRDTVVARTNVRGLAILTARPGVYARRVRRIGYEYILDTIRVAGGDLRTDSLMLEITRHCLGQPCYSTRKLAQLHANYRRIAAEPWTWRCAPPNRDTRDELAFWQERLRDTVMQRLLPMSPTQRRARPQLVTDRTTCRRIAGALKQLGLLQTATLHIVRLGRYYHIEQDGDPRIVLTRDLRYHLGFISQ